MTPTPIDMPKPGPLTQNLYEEGKKMGFKWGNHNSVASMKSAFSRVFNNKKSLPTPTSSFSSSKTMINRVDIQDTFDYALSQSSEYLHRSDSKEIRKREMYLLELRVACLEAFQSFFSSIDQLNADSLPSSRTKRPHSDSPTDGDSQDENC